MRSGKTPAGSKIPFSGGKAVTSGSGVGPGVGAAGPRCIPAPSPPKALGAIGGLSKMPTGPIPAQPKFTPFKKPNAPAADTPPSPMQDGKAPVAQAQCAGDAVVTDVLVIPPTGPERHVDAQHSRSSSPEPAEPCRPGTSSDAQPVASGCDSTPDYQVLPAACRAEAADFDNKAHPGANEPVLVASAPDGRGSDKAPCSRPDQKDTTEPKPLQHRLERLFLEAGIPVAKPEGLKMLAAAIVEACQAESSAGVKTTSSDQLWLRLAWGMAAAVLACVGGLILCVAWIMWVLMQRNIVGSPVLTNPEYPGYFG